MTERSPGVWWLRAYAGRNFTGKPLQISRTVHGGKRLAQAELAKLVTEVAERAGEVTQLPRGMTITYLLERWLEYLTTPGRAARPGGNGRRKNRFGYVLGLTDLLIAPLGERSRCSSSRRETRGG
jgi:hypothetical protein